MDRVIDSVLRSPLALAAGLRLYDALSWVPPFDTGWRHLKRWQAKLEAAGRGPIPDTGRRILMLSWYSYWVDFGLPIALILAAQGHRIDFAWAGGYAVTPETRLPRSNGYWLRSARAASRRFRHNRIKMIDLQEVPPAQVTAAMNEDAGAQAFSDTPYIRLKERIDLHNADDRRVYEHRRSVNLDAIARVETLLQTSAYDRVLLPSGGILEFGAAYRHMHRARFDVLSYECSDTANSIWMSTIAPVVALETGPLWEADAPHVLTPVRKARVDARLSRRRAPKSDALLVPFQISEVETPEITRQRLGLVAGKPTVLICPNVPFDAIFAAKPGALFSGMWQWLGVTVEHLAKRPDVNVVIRCHPAEKLFVNAPETQQSIIAEFLPALPTHFSVFGPEHPVSTYSLMGVADLGITYASTTGLEMAVQGIPVISGNPSHHYNRKGFTTTPETLTEYLSAIDRVSADPKGNRLSPREIELAYCYMDLYLTTWHRDFPWSVTRQARDWREWPPDRVLSEQGMQRFGSAFQALAT